MRATLMAGLMALASPALANQSDTYWTQYAVVRAVTEAMWTDKNCPNLKVDTNKARGLLKSNHIRDRDLTGNGRFADLVRSTIRDIESSEKNLDGRCRTS